MAPTQENTGAPRSSGWMVSIFALLITTLTATLGYYLWSEFPDVGEDRAVASNLGFFLLINLNIIVVMILVFLVAKNIITLALDRRRKILGSRLRTRLVSAFVALSLVPTVLLFLVAKGILESVLQGWFSPQVAASVDGALNLARYHSDTAHAEVTRDVRHLGRQLALVFPALNEPRVGEAAIPDDLRSAVQAYLRGKREEYGLHSIAVVDAVGNEIARTEGPSAAERESGVPGPNLRVVERVALGAVITHPELSLTSEFLRGYAPVKRDLPLTVALPDRDSESGTRAHYVVIGTLRVTPELGNMLSSVINAYDDYNELRTYRRPLASSYLLTLVVVTLLIVFTAVWVGFYLAKSLAVPIGLLGKATAQVAHGNLEYQIPEVGDDELSVLVRSFNTMTADLKATTDELVARRRYMEAVFASVGVGIISVNENLQVQAINDAACSILGVEGAASVVRRELDQAVPAELAKQVREIAAELFSTPAKTLDANVSLSIRENPKHLLLTVTKLTDDSGKTLGAVLLVNDITELVSAQRMAAWREVARRIAHEIKNPLTPIQLCAQRMQRRFKNRDSELHSDTDRDVIVESTDIIVKQVENLRSLVNEFSRFARMPKSSPRMSSLNGVIGEMITLFRETHPDLRFELALDAALPEFELDPEQIGRALLNLLDNAVAAVKESPCEQGVPTIQIASHYDAGLGLASVLVSDCGIGISEKDKPRLFEPYFSTKRGGTGLGLAIVSAIVADHNGFIRVRDNKPRGTTFTIELPVTQSLPIRQVIN
ncbi:MAG: ATP-binding protein [Bdellovibrionota bacterium]